MVFPTVVTGICRVSVIRALDGVKATVIVQEAAGARVLQLVVGIKFEIVTVGVAICRGMVPVFVRVMV